MMDVVDKLRSIEVLTPGQKIPEWANQPNGWGGALSAMCKEAREEIERLRSLAGAVSQGQTFAEIRRDPGIRSSTA